MAHHLIDVPDGDPLAPVKKSQISTDSDGNKPKLRKFIESLKSKEPNLKVNTKPPSFLDTLFPYPNPLELEKLLQINNDGINSIYFHRGRELNSFQRTCIYYSREELHETEKPNLIKCLNLLFENGLNVNYIEPLTNFTALEFSLYTIDKDIISLTLEKCEAKGIYIGNFSLLTTLLYIYESFIKNDSNEFSKKMDKILEIIELLLEKGIDIDTVDEDSGASAIYLASSFRCKRIVSFLIDKYIDTDSNLSIDLDYFVDEDNFTSRALILKYNLYNKQLPDVEKCKLHKLYSFFGAVQNENTSIALFTQEYNKLKANKDLSPQKIFTLLLRAIHQGADEIVDYMLRETESESINRDFEVMLYRACAKGYYKVVNILFDYVNKTKDLPDDKNNINFDISLIESLIMDGREYYENRKVENSRINYNRCLEHLLENKDDKWKNENLNKIGYQAYDEEMCILQFALEHEQEEMVKILLENNASLITGNKCFALEIDPQTLVEVFDGCITYEKQNTLSNKSIKVEDQEEHDKESKKHSKSKIEINYEINLNLLLPARTDDDDSYDNFTEMGVLENFLKDSEYNDVLLHPLCQIFVALKWSKVSYYFYIDAILYLIYAALLTTYVFLSPIIFTAYILAGIASVWELTQILIFGKVYFGVFESWTKLILIFATWLMIGFYHFGLDKDIIVIQINACLILVSYLNVFFLLGYLSFLPNKVVTNIIMLKTVYFTFIPSLITYLPLVFAFVTSFYAIFPTSKFFSHYPTSIFRTLLMSTGEYDSDSLELKGLPASYFIVSMFIIFISIGLLNLLTGLAISDIQHIKENSELLNLKTKIKQIARLENIFFAKWCVDFLPCLKNVGIFSYENIDRVIQVEGKDAWIYYLDKDYKKLVDSETDDHQQAVFCKIPLSRKLIKLLKVKRKLFVRS